MTKLESIEHKIFASEAPLDEIGQFGSALDTTKLNTKDVTTIQALPAYTKGWGSAIISDNNYPTMEEMNGVLNVMSYHTGYLYQEGIPVWRNDREYSATSIVKEPTGTKLFHSLKDGNIGNPLSNTEYWEELKLGGGGLEICDIGMALYVDESKGLRRYLNGQIVDINTNTQAFLNRLKEIKTTNPDYFTTEENWQAEATLNIDGCVYKFVLNYASDGETIVSVRLPKYPDYVEVSAGSSITTAPVTGFVRGSVNSGIVNLPSNAQSSAWDGKYSLNSNGKYNGFTLFAQDGSGNVSVRDGFNGSQWKVDAQADLSNLKLKNTKLKLYYFIQIATGSETENNIINEIELNNPYSLFECKYSDHELFNLSWLVSNGSYNGSNAVHPSAYQALLVENNSEVAIGSTVTLPNGVKYTKQGLSVKLSTETYTDYDFVLNTTEGKFRLPIKPRNLNNTRYLIEAGEQDGIYYRVYSDGWCEQGGFSAPVGTGVISLLKSYNNTNYSVFLSKASMDTQPVCQQAYNLTTSSFVHGGAWDANSNNARPSFWKACGYLAEGEYTPLTDNILLYFYVGETVQNANLIDAGRIGEQLANKVDISNTQWATNACMPDYSAGITKTTNTLYTAEVNGFIWVYNFSNGSSNIEINGTKYTYQSGNGNGIYVGTSVFLPISKDDTYKVDTASRFIFYPLKGAK